MVSFCSSSSDFSCLISRVADKKSSGDIPEKNKKRFNSKFNNDIYT